VSNKIGSATQVLVLVGDVRVQDTAGTRAEAVALRGGSVLAVGARAGVQAAAGPGASVIETGATVLPGFVDPHHHASLAALWGGLTRLEPPLVTDIASLQRALARSVERLPKGQWAMATHWDEMNLAERRAPTRQELDDAVPEHPLLAMHYTCHRAVANSRALDLAGIDASFADPSGGAVERGAGGLPTGLLIERGMSRPESLARASLVARDVEGFVERFSRHQEALFAAGITSIVDATVPRDVATLYRELVRRGVLRVGTTMMPVSISGYLEEPWDALEGPVTGDEEGPLRVGPIKLVFDGAPGCAMCLGWWQTFGTTVSTWAMAIRHGSLDPIRTTMSVSPRVGAKIRTGIAIYRQDEAKRVIDAVLERGFAIATHAIGNEAVSIALGAYEGREGRLHKAATARLEHAVFLDRELVARIAGVGAAVVTQPHLVTLPAYASAASIPGMRNLPHRWLLDAGVTVAASSDFPVAGFDPLDGIRSAVTRRTRRGRAHEPDQCMTLDEAVAAYTRVAAEVAGIGDRAGTLERGKRADLVVLDRPLDERTLADARVRATLLAGEVVFGGLEERGAS
jgi:predicted amidohydrolase YtcJ